MTSTPKPVMAWFTRHRRLARLIPVRVKVWLVWREVRRDPVFMAYLAELSRQRRAGQ